jgi:hypothetical protein
MTPSQQFLKFAADCESMARLTHDPRNEPVWRRLAERWVRCAEWAERESLAAQNAQFQRHKRKRDKRPELNLDG